MTPQRKTTGILVVAGAVAVAASLLTMATRSPHAGPAADGTVQVRAQLQSSHVLVGTNDTHMAVVVQAPEDGDQQVRPPLSLAIVIDRSGSMSGEKLDHAKLAARQLVTRLRDTDRFAVVSYGSDVSVVFPSRQATGSAKDAAITAIDAIYDDGGTNLSGGLIAGRDEVMPHRGADTVSRIVLISDGMANEGISDRGELAELARATAERGVSVTTIGVGLDFDEHTMTSLAVSGAGSYYFVESSAALAQIFDDELRKVGATTATEVRVSLEPAIGIEILEAYGYELVREGTQTIISMADLHAGETRKVVLRLRVQATKPGAVDIADVKVRYRKVADGTQQVVAMRSRAEATGNAQVVLDNRDKDTTLHVERARTARAINDATTYYEKGDYAAAQRVLSVRKSEAKEIASDMGFAELEEEVTGAAGWAEGNMQAAPAARGVGGSRAKKANRKGAYDMMY